MLDRLFSNPMMAFGFIIAVVYLAMFYFAQRERSKVAQKRGQKLFQPKWRSGRRHRRRRSSSGREGFSPQWSRKQTSKEPPKNSTPSPGE